MLRTERDHTWSTLGLLSLVFGAALVLSAWTWQASGAAEGQPPTANDTVEVSVVNDSLALSSTSLDTGYVAFTVTNDGNTPHSFAMAGPVEQRLENELAVGETQTLNVNLDPGTYTAYCPIKGHSAEESAEFVVGE